MKEPTEKIMLDRERTLRMDFNVLADIDEATGLKSLEGEPFRAENIKKPAVLRALLWASLREDDPELTERDAGKLMTLGNVKEIMQVIGGLYKRAAPAGGQESGAGGRIDGAQDGGSKKKKGS